jgi:hypothetical protein
VFEAELPESTFQERLTKAVEGYLEKRGEDGGWGEDRFPGAPSSIVNTVEVLAILRAGGVRYEDEAVQDALTYLTKAVVTHPLPDVGTADRTEHEARGEHTRYCAWGLSGLTLYKASRHDPRLADAQLHCVEWLRDRMWTDAGPWARAKAEGRQIERAGAWGEYPDDPQPSLLSTSAAIAGLSRMCSRHVAGGTAEQLVKAARRAVRARVQRPDDSDSMAFWRARRDGGEGEQSPSATAMAVISLAGGDEHDRSLADDGARWLLSRIDEWQEQIENDSEVPDANWHHMTFSLALRAVLRGAQLPSSESVLLPVVGHLNALWSDEHGEWAHGLSDLRPSPSGSYAVVAAYEAMANAWPFDAQRQILEATAAARRSDKPARLSLHVGEDALTVQCPDRARVTVKLPARFAPMMTRLARGDADGLVGSRSLGLLALANVLELEVDTVKRYTREINKLLKSDLLRHGESIGEILQLPTVTTGDGKKEKRVRLNVEKVTFD